MDVPVKAGLLYIIPEQKGILSYLMCFNVHDAVMHSSGGQNVT